MRTLVLEASISGLSMLEIPASGAKILICIRQWTGASLVWNTAWWRHQMETFSAPLAICAGNSPVTGEFPAQRPVTRSFDVFFDLRLNKWLSKQSWSWWSETPPRPLWRHSNEAATFSPPTHSLISDRLPNLDILVKLRQSEWRPSPFGVPI